MRLLKLLILAGLLSGCASTSINPDGVVSYRYSTFNFSGDTWTEQQRRCAAQAMKPRHLGTDCGFWSCVSRYVCEARP